MELNTYVETPCEIFLVDDASTDADILHGVHWWMQNSGTRHIIRYTRNPENLGFGGSMNFGASLVGRDIIVLLSNDVVIYSDFVQEIVELLNENPRYFIGGEVLYDDTGWNVVNNTIIPYANGWLLACTRSAWDDIGGFDLLYQKFDYEDIDISAEAVSKGYILKGLTYSKLKHIGGATIYPLYGNRRELTLENQKKFIEKWKDRI
jgi:GT2 family glycosyltransferase